MPEAQKRVVPKFASFRKPAPSITGSRPEPEPTNKDERREDLSSHDNKSHERRHQREHRHERSGDQDSRRRDKKRRHEELIKAKSPEPPTRDFDDNDADLYRVDRKGDISNLKYGSLHKYSIPPYQRFGYGSVLGLDPKKRIDRDLSTERQLVLQEPGVHGKSVRQLLAKPNLKQRVRLILPNEEDQQLDHDQDFVLLLTSKKRKRGSESPIPEQGEVDYRSIEGKIKPSNEPADADVEYITDSSTADNGTDGTEIMSRLKNGELTRRTQEQPTNLSAWLDLIEHQAVLFEGNRMAGRALSASERRNLADIKLSIYEKALDKIGKNPEARATLWLGLLKEGNAIWEAKKLAGKWQEALHAHPGTLTIWTEYLNFIQTSFAEFRYERCKAEYMKCLQILSNANKSQNEKSKSDSAQIMSVFAYLFLRITVFMRESGYQEHAEALWQAALETAFSIPQGLNAADIPETDIVSSFGDFWESETPRIGETGSKGWSHFSPESQNSIDPVVIEPETVKDKDRPFEGYGAAEHKMSQRLIHPGRSADEAGEDDPYHIIFFDDIKPFFFPKMVRLVPQAHLVHAFLCYLGLPPLASDTDRVYDGWWLDPFLRFNAASKGLDFTPLDSRQINTEILFSDAFDKVELCDSSWVRRVLERLVEILPGDDRLAEYNAAFIFHYFPPIAARVVKTLLKARSSSLRLYNCYGIIESRSGRRSAANRVFATAIGMSASLSGDQQRITVLLWRTWIWEAVRSGDSEEAVRRLLSIGELNPSPEPPSSNKAYEFSPPLVLRVTRWLSEGRDGMVSTGNHGLAVLHTELLAMLGYFRSSTSVGDALTVFSETSALFTARNLTSSPAHEQLHQCRTQLLNHHIEHAHLFKPSVIRGCFAESTSLFPNNTAFLTSFIKLETRFRMDDRVRLLMASTVLKFNRETVVGWFFAIWAEIQRGLEFGGTVHAVRAAFERAVESNVGAHSIALWKSYFVFERSRGDVRRSRLIFFRGLRSLPWSKWFIMLAFEYLEDDLSFEDLRSIWNVFGERELRIHVDIDALLEEIAARRTSTGLLGQRQ